MGRAPDGGAGEGLVEVGGVGWIVRGAISWLSWRLRALLSALSVC